MVSFKKICKAELKYLSIKICNEQNFRKLNRCLKIRENYFYCLFIIPHKGMEVVTGCIYDIRLRLLCHMSVLYMIIFLDNCRKLC